MQLKGKSILITGANGLVGIPTVQLALEQAAQVCATDLVIGPELVDLASRYHNLRLVKADLTEYDQCRQLFEQDVDVVIHLAGVKGSPLRAKFKPADYFIPMVSFNTNIARLSQANNCWLVYMSSVGVYSPSEEMNEEDVWNTMPSENDWYPGWAKRCGELAIESLSIQYNWNRYTIIRPANIFGEHDQFNPDATVIASNVYKLFNTEGDLVCWGDGSARRDFVFARDVAWASLQAVENEIIGAVNFGRGAVYSILETIEILVDEYKTITNQDKNVIWDHTKPNGDKIRKLGTSLQKKYKIYQHTDMRQALRLTLESYKTMKESR